MSKNSKKTKKKHIVLKIFLAIIFIIILFVGGFVGYSAYKHGWGMKGLIQTAIGQDEKKLKDLDPFTVLLLGVSEDISSKLTDTIIVASYNPKNQKATLLSIPRDTFVGTNKNKATSYDKINALYQSSPQKTMAAVNKLTGLDIQYYVVINNNALVQLVDEIGGVEFDVPINMDYDDSSQDLYIHLKAGPQKLNGEQAEWLVRFRKNNNGSSYPASYGDNDLGRMRTQREFLTEVAKQTLQLKNITKIGSFVDILKQNVQTNISNWSIIKDYVAYAVDFNTENIEAASLPGEADYYNKLSFFIHNEKQTKALVDELFTKQNGSNKEENLDSTENSTETDKTTNNTSTNSSQTKTNSKIKIELLNGSGDSTLLTKATKALKDKGYNVYKTGTTTTTSKTTIVNRTAIQNDIMEDIKDILKVGNIQKSTSSSSTVDVKIVIGKDYK
jgi:LCP family protein required for cell wall assembly